VILQESIIYRRGERLNKLTDVLGLGEIYGARIERIKAQVGINKDTGGISDLDQ